MINFRYSNLTLSEKILIPMLSVFLGMWTLGTVSVGYLETRKQTAELKRETHAAAVQISKEIENAQEILNFKTKSIVDIYSVKAAVEDKDDRQLLQVLLPLRSSFELDLIKIIDPEGRLLADTRSSAVGMAQLADATIIERAKKGLTIASLLIPEETEAEDAVSPLLIKTLSIESVSEDVGSILVGYTLTPEILSEMNGDRPQQIVLLQNSKVIATTLPEENSRLGSARVSDRVPTELAVAWSKRSATIQEINIDGIPYLSRTINLPKIADDQFHATVLTPLTEFRASQRQMWLLVSCFGVLGGIAVATIGLWVTVLITRRITTLTTATQALAKGDLTVRLPVGGNDEVATLATGFNHMVEQLNYRDAKIKHQVEELERLVKELQQMPQQVHTEKMAGLGQMVAGVAHEINNPVSFIYGNVTPAKEYVLDLINLIELYRQYFPNPPQAIREEEETIDIGFIQTDLPKLLDSMQVGARRIREIVLSLRNFSRKDESAMKAVSLNEGLDSTLAILGHRLKAQADVPAIKVVKDYGTLPAVYCFAGELNQAFMNIISNAIDAIDDKIASIAKTTAGDTIVFSPQIRIQTDTIGDDAVIVRITNNGSSIPENIKGKLFDPFFTTKAVGEGTGLGLSISYQIVTEKHSGKIWIDTSTDSDTEFVVQLPIACP